MTATEITPYPITALRQKLQQLKALHDEGTLGAEAYASAKAPLERELLDRVMAQPAAPVAAAAGLAAAASASTPRPSKNLLGGLSVAVLALAVGGYLGFGSPAMRSAGPPGSAPAAEAAQDMVAKLSGATVTAAAATAAVKQAMAHG